MCYLKSDEKIFGITSYQKSTVKCGIFDFNKLSWKCVADYKYKSEVNSLDITVCGNNIIFFMLVFLEIIWTLIKLVIC